MDEEDYNLEIDSEYFLDDVLEEEYEQEEIKPEKKEKRKTGNYVDNEKFIEEFLKWKDQCEIAEKLGKPEPKIPDYIGHAIIEISKGISRMRNRKTGRCCFINYCVDIETEALTKRGWLKYNEITYEDEILSYDVQTKKLKWSKILNLFINENYYGKMFRLTNVTLDALVTPGHKFVTKQKGIVPVEKLLTYNNIVTMGSEVESDNEIKYYEDEFVNLVGWFVTEGSFQIYNKVNEIDTSYCIFIHQKKDTDAYFKIKKYLSKYDATQWKECNNTNSNNISNFRLYDKLSKDILEVGYDKDTNVKLLSYDFILKLTPKQRLMLIDSMIEGNGYKKFYYQKNEEHTKRFLMLCTLSGISTTCRHRTFNTKFGERSIYITTLLKGRNACSVSKTKFYGGKRNNKYSENVPTIDYKGVVWCPTTEYGTFVCRRGEKIYVTGNSFVEEMISEGIEHGFKYLKNFNPEKSRNPHAFLSMIIYNTFLRFIQYEKKNQYVKYKLTEMSNILDEGELLELEDGTKINLEPYSNLSEFIEKFENDMKQKKEKIKKKKLEKNSLEELF